MEDLLARLLGAIRDPLIAEVARLRLEGNTNKEIAHRLNLVEKTIERKIALIRRTWLSFGDDDPDDSRDDAASSALPGPAEGPRDHGR
ncbi:MAG: ECF-type sigma factor [Isosphaeraceae bacterium]